jgi:hypothetical protein
LIAKLNGLSWLSSLLGNGIVTPRLKPSRPSASSCHGANFVLKFDLLHTVTSKATCFNLIEIEKLRKTHLEGYGAGEGIRTLDPNLGKVVLYH